MAKTRLPGFGRPLNYIPKKGDPEFIKKPFPSALSAQDIDELKTVMPMTTLREFMIMDLMDDVTDKNDWHIKIQDPEIRRKWKEEMLSSTQVQEMPSEDQGTSSEDEEDTSMDPLDITPKMVDWCLDELQYKASLISPGAPMLPIFVYNGDVYKSDYAVSPELKEALQGNIKKFESNIPDKAKDWHPGSDQKVWDLVHPSLFPLVYGRTRVLSDGETTTLDDCIQRCGQGKISSIPTEKETKTDKTSNVQDGFRLMQYPFSAKFQWLPCEVDVSGDQAKITSYINNLHPQKEKPLYEIISQLITASIPLWELTLAPLVQDNNFSRKMRISYTGCEYDPDPEQGPETEGPQREPDEDEDDYDERREEWYQETRVVVRPEPEGFEPLPSPPKLDFRKVYGKQGLQVIVKLANIELAPEKPEYGGGSWHVEGHMNEHIVATALYYYSSVNITSSRLTFRQQCNADDADDIGYEQNHHDWLEAVFGCEQEGPCVQEIGGGLETREGRLLTFPNILQHCVSPFELEDPTKPGHRKIVALFLVDPNIKVISTAHVPCQRKDWWIEATLEKQGQSSQVKALNDLPAEVQDIIFKEVDGFPIDLEDAKALRLELMKEREKFSVSHGKFLEANTFSLCEH